MYCIDDMRASVGVTRLLTLRQIDIMFQRRQNVFVWFCFDDFCHYSQGGATLDRLIGCCGNYSQYNKKYLQSVIYSNCCKTSPNK